MHRHAVKKLVVVDTVASYSPAIDMIDADAIEVEGELLVLPPGAKVSVNTEQSNDLENWQAFACELAINNVGYHARAWSHIAARYVRFKVSIGLGSGTAVAMLGVATTKL